MKHPFQTGFSLVELAIVLLIVTILLLATLPNYRNALLKMRRAEARTTLYTVMLQQERFYTQHNTYSAFSDRDNSPFKIADNRHYHISATSCHGKQLNQCVLLSATPNTDYMDDPICGKLMLDSEHNKTYSNADEPNPLCW